MLCTLAGLSYCVQHDGAVCLEFLVDDVLFVRWYTLELENALNNKKADTRLLLGRNFNYQSCSFTKSLDLLTIFAVPMANSVNPRISPPMDLFIFWIFALEFILGGFSHFFW